jgi:hypothetical protein
MGQASGDIDVSISEMGVKVLFLGFKRIQISFIS